MQLFRFSEEESLREKLFFTENSEKVLSDIIVKQLSPPKNFAANIFYGYIAFKSSKNIYLNIIYMQYFGILSKVVHDKK